MTVLLTRASVGKRVGLTDDAVKLHQRRGRILPCAVTESGISLFHPIDVEAFRLRLARERGDLLDGEADAS